MGVCFRSRPVIYGAFSAHCMNWHGQAHQNIEENMKTFGYMFFYRGTNSWTFSKAGNRDGNLLIIPKKRLADFAWCCKLD